MGVIITPQEAQRKGVLLNNIVAKKGGLRAQAQGKDVTLRQKGNTWTAWCDAWRFPVNGTLLAAPPAPDPRRMRPAAPPLESPRHLPGFQDDLLDAERPHLLAAARMAQARYRARDISVDAQSCYVSEAVSATLELLAKRADAFLEGEETTLDGAVSRAARHVLPDGDPLCGEVAARVREIMDEAKARTFDPAHLPVAALFFTGTGSAHRVTDVRMMGKHKEKWMSSAEEEARKIAMGKPVLEGISEAGRVVFLIQQANQWIMTPGLRGVPVKGSLLSQDPLPEPASTDDETPGGP